MKRVLIIAIVLIFIFVSCSEEVIAQGQEIVQINPCKIESRSNEVEYNFRMKQDRYCYMQIIINRYIRVVTKFKTYYIPLETEEDYIEHPEDKLVVKLIE